MFMDRDCEEKDSFKKPKEIDVLCKSRQVLVRHVTNALLQEVLSICIVQIQLVLTFSYDTQSVSMTLMYLSINVSYRYN